MQSSPLQRTYRSKGRSQQSPTCSGIALYSPLSDAHPWSCPKATKGISVAVRFKESLWDELERVAPVLGYGAVSQKSGISCEIRTVMLHCGQTVFQKGARLDVERELRVRGRDYCVLSRKLWEVSRLRTSQKNRSEKRRLSHDRVKTQCLVYSSAINASVVRLHHRTSNSRKDEREPVRILVGL